MVSVFPRGCGNGSTKLATSAFSCLRVYTLRAPDLGVWWGGELPPRGGQVTTTQVRLRSRSSSGTPLRASLCGTVVKVGGSKAGRMLWVQALRG